MESSPPVPPVARAATSAEADPWTHAVRVAFLTSTVAAAAFVILYRFLGVSPWIAIPGLVFAGWLVGCHLPVVGRPQAGPGPGLTLVAPLVEDDFGEGSAGDRTAADHESGDGWSFGQAA